MELFTWLFVGHLVGDWVLQNDWMSYGKKRGWFSAACLTHCSLYTACIMGAYWLAGFPLNSVEFAVSIAIIFLTHWVIDASNLVDWWLNFYRKAKVPMLQIMVDQTFHMVILALVVAWFAVA